MLYQIILLALVYILFSIAPIFVKDLAGMSPISISFYRFFAAGVIEFLIVFILLYILKKQMAAHKINKSYWDLMKNIGRNYYLSSNSLFFRGRKQISYLIFLGVLVVDLSVPFYFLSFSLAGLVVSTIFVNGLTLLVIALSNWIRKEEKLDVLKLIYILLLIASIFTIGFSYGIGISPLTLENLSVIFLAVASYSSFLIWIARDSSSKTQIITDVNFILMDNGDNLERTAIFLKALLKLAGIHLFGSILLIPISALFYLVTPTSILGSISFDFLTSDLFKLFEMIGNLPVLALIILCTVIPYFLLVYTGINWPRAALKQDMWSGVFALLDPLIGIYIGFFIWQESIRLDYIIFTTLFLIAGIVIRYFYEVANARTILFVIKIKQGYSDSFLAYIEPIKEIDRIDSVLGTYDFLCWVTVRSMIRLEQISDKINYFPGVEKVNYSVAEPEI